MRKIMAVYDVDPFYAARFAEVVNQKETMPYEVVAFTSMEKLYAFSEKHPVALLLLGGELKREEAEAVGAGQIIVLSEGETAETELSCPSVYKYQSTDAIVREVMEYCCDETASGPVIREGADILGVYSPVSRCLKTSLAITMGKILAQEERTLYVNLEEFSGLSSLTRTEYRSDLSDLLYFFSEGNYNLLRLNSVVHTTGGLDYIPPARYPEDLDEAGEQAAGLIRAIARESGYEKIVVDAGNCRKTALPVMKLCRLIYMPVLEDGVSRAKLEEFDRYLSLTGNADLRERIRKLKLPRQGVPGRNSNYLDQLLWSELGDYVRQLLRGR